MITHDCYSCKSSYPCDDICKSLSHPVFSVCDSCLDDYLDHLDKKRSPFFESGSHVALSTRQKKINSISHNPTRYKNRAFED